MSRAIVSHQVGGLNLHNAPGMKATVIGTAAPGDVVEVLTLLHSGWAYVSYRGVTGYMWSQHLDAPAEEVTQPPGNITPRPGYRPPAWMYIAATIAIGFILAVVIVFR